MYELHYQRYQILRNTNTKDWETTWPLLRPLKRFLKIRFHLTGRIFWRGLGEFIIRRVLCRRSSSSGGGSGGSGTQTSWRRRIDVFSRRGPGAFEVWKRAAARAASNAAHQRLVQHRAEKYRRDARVGAKNTHLQGKYHCPADLLFG